MKFTSKAIGEHKDVPLADEGRLENVIEQFTFSKTGKALAQTHSKDTYTSQQKNRCYVLSISQKGSPGNAQAKLDEILGLVHAQGDETVGHEMLMYNNVVPKTFLGKGALLNAAKRASELDADLLVLDVPLSPSQMRNIEHLSDFSISDRESVILNIFVKHAKSSKSRIQVEIAQLTYLRPRIRGIGLNMDQQSGGIMGGRGAGETASELLARQLDKRLVQLQKRANKLTHISLNQRKQRTKCKRVALVGYTNAGKTSLMNALVDTSLSVKNQVFETLESTTRRLATNTNDDILISDTVGFIRDLPKHLLNSFESTLDEISETDLLLLVLDSSEPEIAHHLDTTMAVLEKIGAHKIPKLFVFNKIDLVDSNTSINFNKIAKKTEFITVSSKDKQSVERLKEKIVADVTEPLHEEQLFVEYCHKRAINKVYKDCKILHTQSDASGIAFTLKAPNSVFHQIKCLIREGQ